MTWYWSKMMNIISIKPKNKTKGQRKRTRNAMKVSCTSYVPVNSKFPSSLVLAWMVIALFQGTHKGRSYYMMVIILVRLAWSSIQRGQRASSLLTMAHWPDSGNQVTMNWKRVSAPRRHHSSAASKSICLNTRMIWGHSWRWSVIRSSTSSHSLWLPNKSFSSEWIASGTMKVNRSLRLIQRLIVSSSSNQESSSSLSPMTRESTIKSLWWSGSLQVPFWITRRSW